PGLRLLLEPTASPLIGTLLDRVRDRYPDAAISFFAPLESAAPIDASRMVLGAPLVPQYDFTKADVVVSLDADFLARGPFHLRHAADFARRRRQAPATRLYVAETNPSPTGTLADHRLALAPRAIALTAAALLEAVASAVSSSPTPASLGALTHGWVRGVAGDLAAH